MSDVLAWRIQPKPQAPPVRELFSRASCAEETNPILALDLYRDLLRRNGKCFEAWNNLGALELKHNKNVPTATYCFREALALNEKSEMAHCNLAICLMKGKPPDVSEAVKHFERAIALCPGYCRAHLNLAKIYAGQYKFRKAITHYNFFLAYAPQSDPNRTWVEKAIAKLSRQEFQKSRLTLVYSRAAR